MALYYFQELDAFVDSRHAQQYARRGISAFTSLENCDTAPSESHQCIYVGIYVA